MFYDNKALTLLNMDVVGAPHRWAQGKKVSLPKICHTYPEVMKLGKVIPCLDKIKKIYESSDTHLDFRWHQHFFGGNQRNLLYQEKQI